MQKALKGTHIRDLGEIMELNEMFLEVIENQNGYWTDFTIAQLKDLFILEAPIYKLVLENLFVDQDSRYKPKRKYDISDFLYYFWAVLREYLREKAERTRIVDFKGDRVAELAEIKARMLKEINKKLPKWARSYDAL